MDGGFDSLDVVGVSLQGTWVELTIVEANVESAQTGTVRAVVRLTKECSTSIESHEKSAELEENGDDIAAWKSSVRGFDDGLGSRCAEWREASRLGATGHICSTNCKEA